MAMSVETTMQRLTRFALRHLPGLVICVLSFGGLCVAQETEVPAGPHDRGYIFAPTGYVEMIAPLQDRVGLRLLGFYAGNLKAPGEQLDVPIRITRSLTITPSYLHLQVPASGLDAVVAQQSAHFAHEYEENQFRIDGTFKFSVHNFEISERNMYVGRFRPTGELNRYRNRITVSHPLAVAGHTVKPFAAYEAYYERKNGGWNRNRVWSGVTVPINKHVAFQPSYIYETTHQLKDVHYLLVGLIFTTKSNHETGR
jgi:hypothetical protein